MTNPKTIALIFEELSKLDEPDFRELLVNFFRLLGAKVYKIHGSAERGADVIAIFEKNRDVVGRQWILFIQAKVKDVNISKWRNNLCAQMSQLYYRPADVTTSHPSSPRRILLFTTGDINNEVKTEILSWNSRLPIPVEAFTGTDFAELLYDKKLTVKHVRKLLDPKVISPREPEVVTFGGPVQDVITIEQIGSKKSEVLALTRSRKSLRRQNRSRKKENHKLDKSGQ